MIDTEPFKNPDALDCICILHIQYLLPHMGKKVRISSLIFIWKRLLGN